MVEKGKTNLGHALPPPFQAMPEKKTIFFAGGVPLDLESITYNAKVNGWMNVQVLF